MSASEDAAPPQLESLDLDATLWERVFTLAPLVLVGTREPEGGFDLAPKHLVAPMWGPWFVFVCSERHATYQNAVREEAFTVSWPRPDQVFFASLAASPRCEEGDKSSLRALATIPAHEIDGVLLRNGYFFLECRLDRVVDGFGDNSLVVGRVVAAHADRESLRIYDREDAELIHEQPVLGYLHPGRFTTVERSQAFPFPRGFKR